jgi:hypothetical protein
MNAKRLFTMTHMLKRPALLGWLFVAGFFNSRMTKKIEK